MKILIFTATYGNGPIQESVDSVNAQVSTAEYQHVISWHNPYPEGDLRNVTEQMNHGRELVLEGGYDAMLSVEHDMLIPPDALQKLIECEAPVVYGVYVFRHGVPILNAYEKYPHPSTNVGESLTLKPKKLANLMKQVVVEVSGIGFGCTLIQRDVLERIPFRHREGDTGGSDVEFAMDCLKYDIRQLAHFGVVCGHWNGAKWIMPFGKTVVDSKAARVGAIMSVASNPKSVTPVTPYLVIDAQPVRFRATQTMAVHIGYESLRMTAGEIYEAPEEDADHIIRGGYGVVVD
jgi:hypothetical protein